MQQPDAIPIADPEGSGDLLAAEPLGRYLLLEGFFNHVEAAKPFGVAGHRVSCESLCSEGLLSN